MLCLFQDVDGSVQVVDPQPMSADVTNCPYALLSLSEVRPTFFDVSPHEGGQVAAAILLVWGVGYVFRLVIKALHVGDTDEQREP
ncbi:MAG: hypothetical protein IH616_24215 [Gemmatimonadales bacterium]|nr:hypothetical protein [Gemmatimonadales bacterium]